MHKQIVADPLNDETAAAAYLDVKKQTLSLWRSQNRGPSYVKIGRNIRYRQSALDAYLNANTVTPGQSA